MLRAVEGVRTTVIGRTSTDKVDVAAADAGRKGIKLVVGAVAVQINIDGHGVARRGVASLHNESPNGLLKEFTPWMLALRIVWRLDVHTVAGSDTVSIPYSEFCLFQSKAAISASNPMVPATKQAANTKGFCSANFIIRFH